MVSFCLTLIPKMTEQRFILVYSRYSVVRFIIVPHRLRTSIRSHPIHYGEYIVLAYGKCYMHLSYF